MDLEDPRDPQVDLEVVMDKLVTQDRPDLEVQVEKMDFQDYQVHEVKTEFKALEEDPVFLAHQDRREMMDLREKRAKWVFKDFLDWMGYQDNQVTLVLKVNKVLKEKQVVQFLENQVVPVNQDVMDFPEQKEIPVHVVYLDCQEILQWVVLVYRDRKEKEASQVILV